MESEGDAFSVRDVREPNRRGQRRTRVTVRRERTSISAWSSFFCYPAAEPGSAYHRYEVCRRSVHSVEGVCPVVTAGDNANPLSPTVQNGSTPHSGMHTSPTGGVPRTVNPVHRPAVPVWRSPV